MPKLCLFLLCFLLFNTVQGQVAQSDSILQATDTTIVTVLGKGDLLQSGLNGKALQTGTAPNLINALDHLPGIFKIHEAGFPLVYRGMSASRLRIERNGALRTGFVTQGYLLDDVNPENVEQINVIKGAESVLHGTGSSGGVIQVNESTARSYRGNSLYTAYGSNQQAKTLGLRLGGRSEFFGWLLSGRTMASNDFSFGGGDTAENSAQDQHNLKLSLYKTDSLKTSEWTWNHDFSSGKIERPQSFQNNPFELRNYNNRYTYQTNIAHEMPLRGVARLEQNLWGLLLETDQQIRNFNGSFTQLNVFEKRNYQKQAFGYRANWYMNSSGDWRFRVGAELITSSLDQQNSRDDFINQVFEENSFSQSRRENMTGLFGMASYNRQNFKLNLSLRGDMARIGNRSEDVRYTALSGGVDLNWTSLQKVNNKLSLTRQFRYPTQDESVGVVFGGRGVFLGNPDIKPEISYQLEWNLTAQANRYLELALSSWMALFEDRITEFFLGNGEFTYRNLARARTIGIEGRVDYQIPTLSAKNLLFLSLSSSFIQGDDLSGEGLFSSGVPLLGIPPARIRLSGKWRKQLSEKLSLNSAINIDQVTAYDRLPSGPIRQTFGAQAADAYLLADLNISANLKLQKQSLQFGLHITNLFDKGYFPFGARIMGMGRNASIYARLSF